jgi:Domain of unknown function (DUF4268)
MELGRLTLVDIRDVWKNETSNFTPWLAKEENLALLAKKLDFGKLTFSEIKPSIGDFDADLVATDESGAQVLIKNQLDITDQKHPKKALASPKGLDGDATIIWIATKFRDEHLARIDWLNADTNSNFNFFGIEIEVYQIGESLPAPYFNVVAKPSPEAINAKKLRNATNQKRKDQEFCIKYWTAFKKIYEKSGEKNKFPSKLSNPWIEFELDTKDFYLCPYLNIKERKICFELQIYLTCVYTKKAFRLLEKQKIEIEIDAGKQFDWQERLKRKASRISTCIDGIDDSVNRVDFQNRDDWQRQHQLIIDELRLFRRVFTERVRALQINAPLEDLMS